MNVRLLPVLLIVSACHRPVPMPVAPLEDAIAGLVAGVPGAVVAVSVRDPETGTTVGLREDRTFHAASTMKVPVLIEVYRRAARGDLRLSDRVPVRNTFRSIVDGSTYAIEDDSDDAIYSRLGEEMAVRDLVDRMITVSSNLATNLVIETVTPDSVQRTAVRLGAESIKVLRGVEDLKAYERGLSNTTTSRDLAVLLSALARGEAVSPEADAAMEEILSRGRFREMIPAGLPPDVGVAHKTGWITEIHHDAAIVRAPGSAPYVLVILTEGIPDMRVSAALGAEITRAVHTRLRGDGRK